MEAKGPREATIFVRPFRETIKVEEGVEVGAGVEKNGDKEDEVVLYWGIAEVAGLVKLKEPGKDELDGKDNALTAMFRFLKLTIEMLRVFKRRKFLRVFCYDFNNFCFDFRFRIPNRDGQDGSRAGEGAARNLSGAD